jgi:hypothetical protein
MPNVSVDMGRKHQAFKLGILLIKGKSLQILDLKGFIGFLCVTALDLIFLLRERAVQGFSFLQWRGLPIDSPQNPQLLFVSPAVAGMKVRMKVRLVAEGINA